MKTTCRGFSLLEVLIAAVLLVVVATAIYLMLFSASATYTSETRAGDLLERARRVTDEISKELRSADISQKLSLNKNGRANSISFRVPKRVDSGTGNVIWSDSADAESYYNAGSPYPAAACLVCYRYEVSSVDANNNRTQDEGRLVRVLRNPANTSDIAGTLRVLSDYVKPPATGSEIFQRGNDDTVRINITFMGVDHRNRVLERNLQTSVSLRNKS